MHPGIKAGLRRRRTLNAQLKAVEKPSVADELAEALKPFAAIAPHYEAEEDRTGVWVMHSSKPGETVRVTVGDARKAREALARYESDKKART